MNKTELLPYFGAKDRILGMFPHKQHRGATKTQRHVYVDHGAPILLVSHIDTVQAPRLDTTTRGAGFDDRLGVYAAHQLCRQYPTWFDLLLTDYEEMFQSTAEYFQPKHRYNVVMELDREGEDYVDYGLASEKLRQAMKDVGFQRGIGTCSDIICMDNVPCNKVNVGLGAYNGHSAHSGFDMDVYHRQIRRVVAFAKLHRGTTWPAAEYDEYGLGFGLHRSFVIGGGDVMCDNCLEPVPGHRLTYDARSEQYQCRDCLRWQHRDGEDTVHGYMECESCGDLVGITEARFSHTYGGFLCGTCHQAVDL